MTAILVPPEHPALPGHFPGDPVVPGVLLLDLVLEAARRQGGLGAPLRLTRAKFVAPVRPGESLALSLTRGEGGRLGFTLARDGTVVLSGEAELAAPGPGA